jgi:uncharacterized protein YecT (DUF1311 family)
MRVMILAVLSAVGVLASASADGATTYQTQDCSKLTVQFDLNECAQANADSADKALNAAYKQAVLWLSTQKAQDDLKASERAWIRRRDKTCDNEVGDRADGGSIWPMEMANCQEKQIAARIRVLKKIYTCTGGVSVCHPH